MTPRAISGRDAQGLVERSLAQSKHSDGAQSHDGRRARLRVENRELAHNRSGTHLNATVGADNLDLAVFDDVEPVLYRPLRHHLGAGWELHLFEHLRQPSEHAAGSRGKEIGATKQRNPLDGEEHAPRLTTVMSIPLRMAAMRPTGSPQTL